MRLKVKALLSVVAMGAATVASPSLSADIDVTAPDGGEVWLMGSTQTITWVSTDAGPAVDLYSSTDSGVSWMPIPGGMGVTNDGSHDWNVTKQVSPRGRVKVVSSLDSNLWDASDANFTIAGVRVTYPDLATHTLERGRLDWVLCDVAPETWAGGRFEINYEWTNYSYQPISDLATNWNLAFPCPFTPTRPTCYAGVKVTIRDSPGFTNVYDESDEFFTIAGVLVEAPTNGAVYSMGATTTVEWIAAATDTNASIHYASEGTNDFVLLADDVPNKLTFPGDNTWVWTIDPELEPSTEARIKVVSGAYEHTSDVFRLEGVKVLSPGSGDHWYIGATNLIEFITVGAGPVATLYYSANGGGTYDTVPIGTVSLVDGHNAYAWVIEEDRTPSTNAVIKAQSAEHSAVSRPFTIMRRMHFVALAGNHVAPYLNWADAATNIQAAIDAAGIGDMVLVSNGIYYVTSGILVTQAIEVVSVSGPAATIIDGSDTVRCVYLGAVGARLEGFTVRNGYGMGGPGGPDLDYGGGILCATGTVADCHVVGNWGYYGGGISCGAGGLVENCRVEANTAEVGAGGIDCRSGGVIRNCLIITNSGTVVGGVACTGTALIENSIVAENRGCGIWLSGGRAQNCTIVRNHATLAPGGVWADPGFVHNAIIYANASSNISTSAPGSEYSFCCTTPLPPGVGNITNDPQLTPSYRLRSTSPCIDAGTSSNAPATDIDGETRWDHPGRPNTVSFVDIGADEFVDLDSDNMADHWENETFGGTTNSNGTADGDDDDLDDLGEYENSTNPGNADTDADKMPDGWEVGNDLDPLADDADQDPDFDTMNNGGEYIADTNPRDGDSVLSILNVAAEHGGIRVDWKGGRDAWQILECHSDLTSTTDQWTAIFGVPPPTPLTNAIIDLGATNRTLFYRIRAER